MDLVAQEERDAQLLRALLGRVVADGPRGTHAKLARESGASRDWLTKFLQGKIQGLSFARIHALCRAADLPFEEFLLAAGYRSA